MHNGISDRLAERERNVLGRSARRQINRQTRRADNGAAVGIGPIICRVGWAVCVDRRAERRRTGRGCNADANRDAARHRRAAGSRRRPYARRRGESRRGRPQRKRRDKRERGDANAAKGRQKRRPASIR